MHLVYPSSEFCKTSVFDFSCDDCNTQGKLEVIVMYNFFWGGEGGSGEGKKGHYGLGGKREFHSYEDISRPVIWSVPLEGMAKIEPHTLRKCLIKVGFPAYILARTTSFEPFPWSGDEKADPRGTSLTWSTNMNEWMKKKMNKWNTFHRQSGGM